jgi:hypothetical protein
VRRSHAGFHRAERMFDCCVYVALIAFPSKQYLL